MSNKSKILVTVDYFNHENPLQEVVLRVYENRVQGTANLRHHVFTRKAKFDRGEIRTFSIFIDENQVHTSIDFASEKSSDASETCQDS